MTKDRPFTDPRMIDRLAKFFPQRCAIEAPNSSQNSFGEEGNTYTTVIGWNSIPCRVAPTGGGEQRSALQTIVEASHTIELSGVYQGITEKMRAIVNGIHYEILLAEATPEETVTRLQVRLVR